MHWSHTAHDYRFGACRNLLAAGTTHIASAAQSTMAFQRRPLLASIWWSRILGNIEVLQILHT
ncbi:hypothetical protein BIFGAL_03457 [Bifidobacterium gallicum DSM 20093 = LMG 11596]|uniref:Uncharacterized protein n=1 Tax=Bifidobacterium gallicum DSM 20093 = LMG 11596 TaxID=561180 RepID=D1NUD4_9BIFI|nr:hypothetical protein BIFGAL_03457 [Bifidobacterium gallicum DSM 20093 = LMG 11596]